MSLTFMPVLAQQVVTFSWRVIIDNLDILWAGAQLTVFVSVVSFSIATFLGVFVALARMSEIRAVATAAAAYINVLRAIPLLVFIVFIYYGVAIYFGLTFATGIQAGIFAFSLQYSAWLGEIFRSGIQAVPKGQREAAMAVGMGPVRTFVTVVLPQAIRVATPPTGNMMVGMVKDSALLYVIGVQELFRNAQLLANRTFRYFEIYLAIVLVYLVMTTTVYYGMKFLEQRLQPVDVLATGPRRFAPLERRRRARVLALRDRIGAEAPPTRIVATEGNT
jgi:His/Glu/Gln/Arg/opine family amino acid ABC transporter permease subunit